MTETSTQNDEARSDYWDNYYANTEAIQRPLPSQFAAFVAGELNESHRLIEFGCGSGRDSMFFSLHGHSVVGIDASERAVKHCTELAAALSLDATFEVAAIDDSDLASRFPATKTSTVLYARFFLHAINDDEERAFLRLASELTSTGDKLAVEYRTVRDSSNVKVTDAHYRRFVEPAAFQAEASEFGFDVIYAVEGYGLAKYKKDDAYVARCILKRR